MHFRLTYTVLSPERVDISVSVGKEKDAHHSPCGVLIMSKERWEAFRAYLRPEIEIREQMEGYQVIEEDFLSKEDGEMMIKHDREKK